MRHILFPTDFSDTAQKALPFALEIALKKKACLTLMHSIEEPYDFAPMVEEMVQRVKQQVETSLAGIRNDIAKDQRYSELKVKTRISYGRTVLSILEEADQLEADLIVMGTTGASGMNKILFGSQTAEIILNSTMPVLAVPAESEYNGLPHITFLTDYNNGDLKALEQTADLASIFGSEISALHVANELNLKEEIMHRGFKDIALKQMEYQSLKFELVVQDNLMSGINEFLGMQSSSLLVMVKYQKPFFAKLLHRDHSKEVSFYTKLPLLILQGEEPY